jgi:SAM-dependent methyltransferase
MNDITIWEIERFGNYNGLMADPTCFERDSNNWDAIKVGILEFIEKLKKHFIIIDDEITYEKRFASKSNSLDFQHFGNFHEQLGSYLLTVKRENPNTWWLKQKFNEDFTDIKLNLYGAVQKYNLIPYFNRKFSQGDMVIDLGCGPGFYSMEIAKTGARVWGIDPNPEFIKIAQKQNIMNAKFSVMEIGVQGGLDSIPSQSIDFVFMSDALLFYFVPPDRNQKQDIQLLLKDIKRILKPNGCFISSEPHYIFWLLPWLGEIKRPFTIMTEYLKKSFGVTGYFSQLIQSFCKGGFLISWMEEFKPNAEFEKIDPRAFRFSSQFPLWHLFELKPNGNP